MRRRTHLKMAILHGSFSSDVTWRAPYVVAEKIPLVALHQRHTWCVLPVAGESKAANLLYDVVRSVAMQRPGSSRSIRCLYVLGILFYYCTIY
jgi:hypothetical protein